MDTNIVRTGRSAPRFHPFVFIACTALALAGSQGLSADTGGPDASGYRFIDSDEAGGPAYNFEDISSTGTRIDDLDDDNMVGPFPLGFTFEYYGTDYTEIYVSSNCFLTVLSDQEDGCCSSETIPDAANPNGIIAGWYEDVDPRVGDVYYETLGTSPNRRFIVQWSAVKLYGFPDTITLEYKLFESDDSIEVHYQQAVTAGQVYAAGIENQTGTVGLQYYRGSADLSTPLAVKYFLNPAVLSIARADADPSNAAAVDFVVTFTEDVAGVDTSDFALTTAGLSGTSISSVTPDSASVYTVTVDTGTGDGTLRLDLDDDDSITSVATEDPLGGVGADNGDFSGETYTIDRTGPQVDAINRLDSNPTSAAQVDFIVKFDESVDGVGTADFSTSTTGSLAGTSVATISPAFGNALDLSNNPEVGGGHLNLSNDSSLQVAALTIEAWVYYQKDGAETIVSKGDGGGGTTDYILQINKDGAGKLNLWAAAAWDNSTTAISPNTWTHVAVTYDGSDKKFYINGVLDNTVPRAGSIAQSGMNAYIGRQGQNADSGHYDGYLDEVRVWSAVREQADIQVTMNSTLIGDETNLVGYWRFEQFQDLGAGGAGVNDVEDCSANSNHGDAVNSPSLATSHFSGLAQDYIVRVNTGTGTGDLRIILEDDDSITDEATNPFGGAGEQDYSAGQTYTVIAAPTVTTAAVSNVTDTTADSGGNVTDDGGDNVTARGVCWSTTANPTTADDKTTDGTGTGAFVSNITGLDPNTTYHVRAYATNSVGTSYGSDVEFTTDTTPTVTTTAISNLTTTTADSGGNVTDDGGATVTARGVCWSTAANPTTADDKTTDGSGTGEFTSAITGLSPGTSYHVRAYATNSVGTSYGADVAFTTAITVTTSGGTATYVPGGDDVVVDPDLAIVASDITDFKVSITGNFVSGDVLDYTGALPGGVGSSYSASTGVLTFTGTASAGDWQALLRTVTFGTSSADTATRTVAFTAGGAIPFDDNGHFYEFVSDAGITFDEAESAAASSTLFGLQGYLVTVTSAAENSFVVSKLAGEGWMGASDEDAESIWRWITGPEGLEDGGNGRHFFTQTSAAETSGNLDTVYGGNTPGGGEAVDDEYNNWQTGEANDWGASGEDHAHFRSDGTWNDYRFDNGAIAGYVVEYGGMPGDPVPQITDTRDVAVATTPTVTTAAVSNIGTETADCGGDVTDDGGDPVTARGVCWSTVANPTTADDKTTDGTGTGEFTSSITGLDPDTTYHVRAYATNSVGTSYGSDVQFTTDTTPTVTTAAVSNLTGATADCGGNVTDDGGEAVTARGVCWSTAANPTTADDKTEDGDGTGEFSSSITGLAPGTTYHVRAYAVSGVGTAYGENVTFATVPQEPEPEPVVELAPVLRVTIEAQTDADALVGDDVVFVATVENVGTATATDVVLTIPIPENAEFVSTRLVTASSAQTADPVVTLGDGFVTLELGDVPAGDLIQVEIVFRVTAAGEVTVDASATSEEITTPKAAETAATIDAQDEYLTVVETTTPVYLCGALGLAPLLVLFGLIGTKLRHRRWPERRSRDSQPRAAGPHE